MRCRLALPSDEPHLRRILADNPMPGSIRTAFEREPDFFRAQGAQGTFHQTLVAEEGGELVGMASRAIRPVHVNGRPMDLGYLGSLRTLARARGGPALHRGFRLLRELHGDGRVPAYLTTILEANAPARALLTSARSPLPLYLDLGRLTTWALLPARRRPDPRVEPGSAATLPEILAFLREAQGGLQFAPVLGEGLEPAAFYEGFRPEDFRVLRQEGRIAGVVGFWNQDSFRQTRITGYAPWLSLLRPALNALARPLGLGRLPAPGQLLPETFLAFRGLRNQDPALLAALLDSAPEDRYLLAAFHERDPLRHALRGRRAIPYPARLYWVCWEEGLPLFESLDPRRVPYLELGRL